jgi:hypothetical protein
VILPCGDSICKNHVKQDGGEFHCSLCDIIHVIPVVGFPPNKALAKLLDEKIQKVKFTPEYTSALRSFKNLEKILQDLKLFHGDAFYFINQTIGELRRETDLLRDEYKLVIDQKADEIINELIKYEAECKSKLASPDVSNKLTKIAQDIARIENQLAKWQKTLNSFEPNESEWKIIEEEGESQFNNLEIELHEHQDDFLLNRLGEYQRKLLVSFYQVDLKNDRK